MLSTQVRAPWWQLALISLCTSLLLTVITLGVVIALAFRGVDVLDYVYLSHPPYLSDGLAAALLLGLIAMQPVAPLLAMLLVKPGRDMLGEVLTASDNPGGVAKRVAAGVVVAFALQVVWAQVGPTPAEHWRVTEHLVYATLGGGSFWPLLWLVVTVGLVVPVAEEILFRGVLYRYMRNRWGFMTAALGSAILFGLAHGPTGALPGAIMGFFLACQVERDDSLIGAMVLHALTNLGGLLAIAISL